MGKHRKRLAFLAIVSLLTNIVGMLPPKPAQADEEDNQEPPPPPKPTLSVIPTGYVEAYYQYNFNRPSNGITNYRGFDNRHNSFTLSNVALGADFHAGDEVSGRILLQVGSTPSTYYGLNEPRLAGASGANASSAELWKYIQEAYVGYKVPIGDGLQLDAGVFLSPIGVESMAVKDSWNWSRSNLFFGLPFYHAGVRAKYPVADHWSAMFHVCNGWNSVVDANEEKSVSGAITYDARGSADEDDVPIMVRLLYFGGVERPTGAPEGPYWRHDFDLVAQWDAASWLAFAANANTGWEPNRFSEGGSAFGTSWYAGALYARVKTLDWLWVAARGDRFWENVASNAQGAAAPLFWGGAGWVSSGTLTLDARPTADHDHLSIRLEYRHDQSDGDLFFRSNVIGDGGAITPFVPNAHTQDTLTLGATSWF